MKNFSNPKQEKPLVYSEPMSQSIPPQINRGSFESVRLSGRNVGASMIADGGSGEPAGSCSINIYINNEIQGVNNSVLIGSEVRMRDPGVNLCMAEMKMDRGFRLVTTKKEMDSLLLVAAVALVISIFAYLLL